MAKYIMLGRYTPEAIGKISGARTKKAKDIINKLDGKLESILALLGEHDLLLITEFPDIAMAVKASLAISKETGIRFRTLPALEVEQFDKLASNL